MELTMKRILLLLLCLVFSLPNFLAAQDLDELVRAADSGNQFAQFNLALKYDNGQGVPQDYTQAVKWYNKAAEQGLAVAQFNLGVMYDNGQGVPQDYTQAVKWYRKAAEQGYGEAQYNLGVGYYQGQGVPQNYSEAYVWFSLAATNGYEPAIYNRDIVVKKLSPEALAAAQKRAAKLFEEINARKQ